MSQIKLISIIAFLIIILLSSTLKIWPVLDNNFPFTTDQGRDMLDIRNIVVGHHFTLIGPTTSINGVFLGPFWYYFNVPAFVLGGGNPATLVYWLLFLYQATAFLIFIYLYRQNCWFGLFYSGLFLMVPVFFYSSRFSWSANPMPFMTALFFLLLITLKKKGYLFAAIIGLIAGLSMQLEAAFAILFFPFAFVWFLLNKVSPKNILVLFLSFGVTLVPQFLFELRHGFVMTHTLINELSGQSKTLGERLTLQESANAHLQSYLELPYHLTNLPLLVTNVLWGLAIIYLGVRLISGKLSAISKQAFLAGILFIAISFLFYLIYHHPLKGWYLQGLHIPLLLILVAFFNEVFIQKNILPKILITLLISWNFVNIFPTQSTLIPKITDRSSDPSNLRNQLEIVDYIYTEANSRPFKVYNYIPSVYDFPYQYLFWWYGTKLYGYQPDTITYLDSVPEYITNNFAFQVKRKIVTSDVYPIFLIYQSDKDNPDRLNAWMNNFEKLCPVKKAFYSFETTVDQKRICLKLI